MFSPAIVVKIGEPINGQQLERQVGFEMSLSERGYHGLSLDRPRILASWYLRHGNKLG